MAAAVAIVDREGYRALSMRRLGAELGVDPMAVYHYFPSKSALLDGLVEAVMGEIDLSLDDPSRTPAERLLSAARAYREVLLAHPEAVPVVVVRPLRTPVALRPVEVLLGILRDAGVPAADSMACTYIIADFVRGTVVRDAPQLVRRPDPDVHDYDDMDMEELMSSLPPGEFPVLTRVVSQARAAGFEEKFEGGIRALVKGLLDIYAKPKGSKGPEVS